MPIISNGQWVPDDHPLYLEDQKKKSGAGMPMPADPYGATPTGAFGETDRTPNLPGAPGGGVAYGGGMSAQQRTDFAATAGQDGGVKGTSSPGSGSQAGLDWQAYRSQDYGNANAPGSQLQGPAPVAAAAAPAYVEETLNGMKGYRMANGGWVPGDHPLATQAGAPSVNPNSGLPTPGAGAPAAGGSSPYTPVNAAPGTPGTTPIDTQNSNAQTYSQTPGGAPLNNTTNQGTQDVVRNSYLQQIQKGTAVDTNDPNFRQQADAYGAAAERARRNAQDDLAQESFQAGTRGSGGDNVERRMMNEKAAQAQGGFEAELVGRELTNRRDEIKNALGELGGMISNDQKNALQRELAALDASIKQQSINQTGALGARDLDLRDKLGTGALNIDMLRALLQNEQFGTDAGIRIGDLEARYSGLF